MTIFLCLINVPNKQMVLSENVPNRDPKTHVHTELWFLYTATPLVKTDVQSMFLTSRWRFWACATAIAISNSPLKINRSLLKRLFQSLRGSAFYPKWAAQDDAEPLPRYANNRVAGRKKCEGGVRVRAVEATTQATNEPFGMAEFCSPLFISFISEESQPSPPPSLFGSSSFRQTGNRCLLPAHLPYPPSHPYAPLLPSSQIQARCQRENKQNSEEEKQKGVDGFTESLIKRLFTSEGEESAGCQAAGSRREVVGVLGGVFGVGVRWGRRWLPKRHQSKSMLCFIYSCCFFSSRKWATTQWL